MRKKQPKKDETLVSIISVLVLIVTLVMATGFSYSYITKKIVGGDNTRVIIKSADILLRYEEGDALQVHGVEPNWAGRLNFSIENYSAELDAKYKVILQIYSPFTEITEESFVYSLDGTSNKPINDNNFLVKKTEAPMPIVTTELGVASITRETIHNYTLNIKFIDNGKDQNYLQNKKFVGKILVESVYE